MVEVLGTTRLGPLGSPGPSLPQGWSRPFLYFSCPRTPVSLGHNTDTRNPGPKGAAHHSCRCCELSPSPCRTGACHRAQALPLAQHREGAGLPEETAEPPDRAT